MSSTNVSAPASPSSRAWNRRLVWIATGLFTLMFVYSGVWSLVDPEGTRQTMIDLGFPVYFLYPQAVAKLVGIAVILWGRSRTLSGLAFAGFLYDLLLALGAHIAEGDPDVWLAVFGLVVWGGAFWADRQRFPVDEMR